MVLSREGASGQTQAQTVRQTFTREVDATLLLRFDNGTEVETTSGHPFFVEGQGWTVAGQLALGNAIVTRAGPAARLTSVTHKAGRTRVYNFEVARFHSYFVGTHNGGLWVHNTSYPDVVLGKFAGQSLEHFTRNLGHNASYFNDWDYNRLGVKKGDQKGLILAAMNQSKVIHFNLQGVDWTAMKNKTYGYLSAEWELSEIIDRGWLSKTRFYFPK